MRNENALIKEESAASIRERRMRRCTFKSLSVSKKKTATQMVDPLNFRFMDARLKNVASFRRRRRRDATRRGAARSILPPTRFSLLQVLLPSHCFFSIRE